MSDGTLQDILKDASYDTHACFLCGNINSSEVTSEHVFPRWLLRKHNLWNKRLNLLNQTQIKYQNLMIPCCRKCNNEHLSRLEAKVEKAFREGYGAVKKLNKRTLYQWIGKLFYGILRKELSLLADVKNHESGTIVSEEFISKFATLRIFLQSIRKPFKFSPRYPFSVLVVKMHKEMVSEGFDFRDSLPTMITSLCSGEVAVIVALQDAGLIDEAFEPFIKGVRGRKLTPIQFDELFTNVVYKVSLLNRVPKFITIDSNNDSDPVQVHMLPLGGLSSTPIMEEWNQEAYARFLATALKRSFPEWSFDKIYKPPHSVRTWLKDENGKLTFYNSRGIKIVSKRR